MPADCRARMRRRARRTRPSASWRHPNRMAPPAASNSSPACTLSRPASETDLQQRGPLLPQRFGAARGQQYRLAAEQIARLRQVLVRMDHEHHALRETGIVVEGHVSRAGRAEAKPMTAPADVRWVAIFTVALCLQHRID